MKDRRLVQRALLRRSLRKEMRQREPEDGALIQLALDDDAVFETLYESALEQAKQFADATGAFSVSITSDGSAIVDNLLKLLQWFATNGPALIEIIRQIVELFGSVSAAQGFCEAETIFVD